jgi:signal transduction histidine kinase
MILKTNLLISGLYIYPWGHYLKGSFPNYFLYLLWFLLAIMLSFYILYAQKKIFKNDTKIQLQINYQLAGFIFLSLCSIDFLPKFGINLLPIGSIFATIYCVIMGYAIIKYQILGINILIKKGVVYTLLIALVSLLYLVIVLIGERTFSYFFNYQSVAISIWTAFGIGLLVFPLRNKIQQIMDRYFFSGTQTEIYEKNLKLQAEVEQAQRLKTATTLASGLAHEIKNPLTAITTFAEYLKDKKDDPEFINNFSKIVGQEADRINDLVNQLTDFAKPGESKIAPNDIHHLIKETLQFLTSQCLKQGIKVDLAYQTPDTVTLNIDSKQIKQVLMNIILNAIEAMPSGGTILIRDEIVDMTTDQRPLTTDHRPQTIDQKTQGHTDTRTHEKELEQKNSRQTTDKEQNTDNKHQEPHERNNALSANKRSSAEPKAQDLPDASCQMPDTFYKLSIIDSGSGISPADIPHLFDPFFSKKDQGTGLGLSVSYGIIEKHGGRLYAENNPDGGAVFIMEMPIPV